MSESHKKGPPSKPPPILLSSDDLLKPAKKTSSMIRRSKSQEKMSSSQQQQQLPVPKPAKRRFSWSFKDDDEIGEISGPTNFRHAAHFGDQLKGGKTIPEPEQQFILMDIKMKKTK